MILYFPLLKTLLRFTLASWDFLQMKFPFEISNLFVFLPTFASHFNCTHHVQFLWFYYIHIFFNQITYFKRLLVSKWPLNFMMIPFQKLYICYKMKTVHEGFKNLTRKFSYHVLNFFFLNVCITFCLNFAGFTCFLPSFGKKF